MSEPTGTKRRRTGSPTSSTTTLRDDEANQGPSWSRLNALIAEAVEMAKLVKPTSADDAAVQQAHKLTNSLLNVLPGRIKSRENTAQILNYEYQKLLLQTSVRALQQHIIRDPIDGWEEQGAMGQEIWDTLIDWFDLIWGELTEEDVNLAVIENCLVVCSNALVGMYAIDCRAELSESEPTAYLCDEEDNTICDESLSQAIVWMWRELLVIAASRNQPTKSILGTINRLGLTDKVCALFRKGKEEKNPDGYTFWDAHWTDDMKEAAAKVRLGFR
ncbi:hypothetical protein D9613_008272 [Agrocybe pediades]|uniref:Uncharacterized protein n=1 Tax=Agrocybe pediades TaxID=84607 RepID=A0A8H4VP26_9AGAR|nr:hypothetical protein D9613_008272 [Agrocybe pediades]